MSSGKEKKARNEQVQEQTDWEHGQRDKATTRNDLDLGQDRTRGDDLYNTLRSKYGSLLTHDQQNAQRSSDGGAGAGAGAANTDTRFADVDAMYKTSMKTGGLDPAKRAAMEKDIATLRGIGYDPETVNRIRGGGVFDEFSKTGGLSEGDRGNIRARATSVIPAMFDRMKSQANQRSMVQGGYGPGADALMGRMGRAQAGAMSDASRDAELGIMNQVNEGRRWGAGSMSDAERGLSSLRESTTTGAMGGERDIMDRIQQGQQWGTAGTTQRAEQDRSYAASQAAAAAAAGRWQEEMDLRKESMGLEGLNSLYSGDGYGSYNRNKDYDLQNRDLTGQNAERNYNMRKDSNKGINWGKVASTAGTVAAAYYSARELKERIKEISSSEVAKALKTLKLYRWSYKGDKVRHIGPMAQEFRDAFKVGDGFTLNVADVLGVLLAVQKHTLMMQEATNG